MMTPAELRAATRRLLAEHVICRTVEETLAARKALEAAIDAEAAAACPQWQPIETAPNKRYLLVWSENDDIGIMRRSESGHWRRVSHRDAVHPDDEPTHWMPLPTAPEEPR